MGPTDCPETSANIYQYTLRNIAEERTSYLLPHFVCISISSPLSVFSCYLLNSIMTRKTGQNRTLRLFAYRQTFARPGNYTNSLVLLTSMPTNAAVLPYVNESGVPIAQSALKTQPLPSQITQIHSRISYPKRLSSAAHRATVALSSCKSRGTFMSGG